MKNAPQPQPTELAEPDMALLFFGAWLATLHDALKRDDAKLDALARSFVRFMMRCLDRKSLPSSRDVD